MLLRRQEGILFSILWKNANPKLNCLRYGPIFPCISCHETNWQSNVVKISNITTINSSYVDFYFVTVSNRELFVKMNFFYLCKTCKKAIDASRMPKRCAKNMLLCPWKDVEDKDFLNMNEVIKLS